MWRERIIEAKKVQSISAKTMSERTGGHLPERTIIRILNGETEFPRIDTILELGQSVGLSAQEVFAETNSIVGDLEMGRLQAQYEAQMADKDALLEELQELHTELSLLHDKVVKLTTENEILRLKLEHKEEIIALHDYYKAVISGMTK